MAQRWIRRLGTARSGFRYVDPEGKPLRDPRRLARIRKLRVPPAWRDVHVAPSAANAVQAWGFDAAGRKQYRYNDRAVERRELRKYHRVRQLAKRLPAARARLATDAASPRLTRDAVAATVLRLIGETFSRVGGERYARENGSFGITTVSKAHVDVDARHVWFEYRGKGKIPQRQVTTDPTLVSVIRRLKRAPGRRLFRYKHQGEWRDLTAADVNDYLRRHVGPFSAKDFRTWGGSLRAATVLAEIGPPKSPTEAKRNVALAMRLVAAELGNTPTVCRTSYVHPMIIARYVDEGETIPIPARRRHARNLGKAHSPEERALIEFLDEHFPERRRIERE